MTQNSLAAVLASIFVRRGANGRWLRVFSGLDEGAQRALRVHLLHGLDEIAVIGGIANDESWLLLTSRRLVWRRSGMTTELVLDKIADVRVDLRRLSLEAKTKLEMQELEVHTFDGAHYIVQGEAGPPLSGLWNALLNVVARNRREQTL